jgi:mono/diheme cytochrome c family protein
MFFSEWEERKRIMRVPVIIGCLFVTIMGLGFGGGGGLKDLSSSAKDRDPVSGREIYVNTCIRCHGIDGKGAVGIQLLPPPADLASPAIQNRLDGTLFKRIHDGKPNTAMGAWSHALSDDEIWDVLAYVRTLGVGSLQQP